LVSEDDVSSLNTFVDLKKRTSFRVIKLDLRSPVDNFKNWYSSHQSLFQCSCIQKATSKVECSKL
jgi:hypothetical protein